MTIITITNEVTGEMQISTDFDRFEKHLNESVNFCKIDSKQKPIVASGFNINQGCNFIEKLLRFYREGC